MVALCCLEDNALGWWLWPSGLWPLGLGHPMDTTHCHGFSFCQIESGTRQTSRNSRGKLSPHPYVLNLTWNSSQTHWNQSCSKLFLFFAMFHQQMICQNIVWDFPWVHEIFHELASKFEELDERCDPIGEQECCFFSQQTAKNLSLFHPTLTYMLTVCFIASDKRNSRICRTERGSNPEPRASEKEDAKDGQIKPRLFPLSLQV